MATPARALPDLRLWTAHEVRRLKPVLPAQPWRTLGRWVDVMRQWVAEPVLRAKVPSVARKTFEDLLPFIDAQRTGLLRVLSQIAPLLPRLQTIVSAESVRVGSRARKLLPEDAAVTFEHAVRDIGTAQEMLFREVIRRSTLPEQAWENVVQQPTFRQLWDSTTRCDGLFIVTAMGVEGECRVRSKIVLAALVEDLSEAVIAHYASAKGWIAQLPTASDSDELSTVGATGWAADWDLDIREFIKTLAAAGANA